MKAVISRESLGLFMVCMIDMTLTVLLVATGLAKEANPLMARCLDWGYLAFCLVKTTTVVLTIVVAERYRRHNPLFVKRILRGAIVLYLGLYFSLLLAINVVRI